MFRPSDGVGGRGVLNLYLLRHGETEFSRGDRFCGDIDAPLTPAGARMGELFADAYGGVPWRAIVTSTRRRTVATAEPIAVRARIQIRRDARLDEMFFGDWQGLTKREAAARDPVRYGLWRQDPTIGPPSGESPFEVSARAVAAIDDLRARYDGGNVLVVSHKTVLRVLYCRLLNIDLQRYRDHIDWPTGAVSLIELAPCHAVARCIADARHLNSFPETGRDLIGEELARRRQPDAEIVGGDPAGGDRPGDLGLASDGGIDPMAGAMAGAIDPVGGA
jgi:broad specificity phosphatase PhoE